MNQAAVIQMVSSNNIEDNLNQANRLLAEAKAKGAALALLPENFAFMGLQDTDKLSIAEVYGQGAVQDALSRFAKHHQMWVVAGSVFLKTSGSRVRAASLVFDNEGRCVARYDKIHLFDVRVSEHEAHEESKTLEPGDKVQLVDTPVGRLGLSICYDLRFSELYTLMREQGAELFSVPAAFTEVTGKAHWEVLLRARAIEHLCYVLAANQGGQHANQRRTYGHSMIVEPWGGVLSVHQQGTGVVLATIDRQRTQQMRQQFPCHAHHQFNIQPRFKA